MSDVQPVRLQLSRKKGFRLTSPNGLPTIVVSRPSVWGNPFVAPRWGLELSLALYRESVQGGWNPTLLDSLSDVEYAALYALHTEWRRRLQGRDVSELRGKSLACWCPEGRPCHADILLELANPDRSQCARERA